jgi:hypothetical protein
MYFIVLKSKAGQVIDFILSNKKIENGFRRLIFLRLTVGETIRRKLSLWATYKA